MAKAGKAYVEIPDSFFAAIEADHLDELESTANAVAKRIESDAKQRLPKSSVDPESMVVMSRNDKGRAVAIVYLQHPGGLALQARHGVMTRAAVEQGLDVRRYKG